MVTQPVTHYHIDKGVDDILIGLDTSDHIPKPHSIKTAGKSTKGRLLLVLGVSEVVNSCPSLLVRKTPHREGGIVC